MELSDQHVWGITQYNILLRVPIIQQYHMRLCIFYKMYTLYILWLSGTRGGTTLTKSC